ncbi:MAG TPA: signal peptidase I [Pyrinomonadaceae bacterium]
MKRRIAVLIAVSVLLILGLVSLVAARFLVFNYSRIPQDGMYPGIPKGSLVFSWRRPYQTAADVKRGDIVIFTRIQDGAEYKFIWRVMGLPGDKVEIDGESILINGLALQRKRLRQEFDLIIYSETNGASSYEVAYPVDSDPTDQPKASLIVPQNSFYVLGDNRFNALDSRFIGPITFDSIVEKKI